MIRVGSLFAGIGGLELGLGWALAEAGIPHRVEWQVEREPFPRAVLARHWPEADRSVVDVCAAGRSNLAPVDVICGGFPCQDLSYAGKGAGIAEGTRSGLWFEYRRIVRELRPRVVVVENVAALLARGLGVVLGDLAALGYDARWTCVRASDVGAPHRRERLFIVAHAARGNDGNQPRRGREGRRDGARDGGEALAHSDELRREQQRIGGVRAESGAQPGDHANRCGSARDLGHADGARCHVGPGARGDRGGLAEPADDGDVAHADEPRLEGRRGSVGRGADKRPPRAGRAAGSNDCGGRSAQPGLGGAPHGLPAGMDGPARWPAGPGEEQHAWEAPRVAKSVAQRAARLKALGNAVVPQVAREVGRAFVVPLLEVLP